MDEVLITILTAFGIVFLLVSIYRSIKITGILRDNIYKWRMWVIVIIMLFGFILGYIFLILNVFGNFVSPISLELVVALVYFFGSIFTIYTTRAVERNLTNILGKRLSDDEAIDKFLTYADLPVSARSKLHKEYSIMCEYCERQVIYSIPDIVRFNAVALDRGISIEEIFGTKSYVLRPSHRCENGRREFTMVHDKDLEMRSIEGSRLIYGDEI